MNFNLRFFTSWISCALVMFSLFYAWHGIFLNDFKRIQFPVGLFVSFAAITYLILSFGIYLIFESSLMKRFRNIFLKGLLVGILSGFTIYIIATIIHISLAKNLNSQHLLMNCSWQIAEQTIGAFVIVIFKVLIRDNKFQDA